MVQPMSLGCDVLRAIGQKSRAEFGESPLRRDLKDGAAGISAAAFVDIETPSSRSVQIPSRIEDQAGRWAYSVPAVSLEAVQHGLGPRAIRPRCQLEHRAASAAAPTYGCAVQVPGPRRRSGRPEEQLLPTHRW